MEKSTAGTWRRRREIAVGGAEGPVNKRDDLGGPLHVAGRRHYRAVAVLVKRGAPRVRGRCRRLAGPALAASAGSADSINVLLRAGASQRTTKAASRRLALGDAG